MELTQPLDVVPTQDPDALVRPAPTSSPKPIFNNQHFRSLSLSCLASPLDALALACEAEQSMTAEANHGPSVGSEPDADTSPKVSSHSSDECVGSLKDSMSQPTPSIIGASHNISPDVLEASSNQKAKSHSTDSLSIEECREKTSHPKSPTVKATNYVSQDFLHEIPSYISVNDVLCGRGGLTNHHPGNIFFRNMVRTRQEEYLRASKRDKANVAKEIVDMIRNQEPPGRFLKKISEKSNTWAEIGDRKAREKTSQALREGAPELRGDLFPHPKPDGIGVPAVSQSEDPTPTMIAQSPPEDPTPTMIAQSPSEDPTPTMIAQSPSFQSTSKDSLVEQFKDNHLSDSSQIPNNPMTSSFDANMDAMSTSSSHSTLPRPRVVSSDSVKSAASVYNSSGGIMDDTGVLTEEDALSKRQKVRHRSFTDSGENHHSIRNLYLPPTRPTPTFYRISSDEAMNGESDDVGKGPRLKLLKARFQREEEEEEDAYKGYL